MTYDEGSTLGIDGTPYDLKQFHFHTPSEHTVEGIRYAMEMHFVHATDDGFYGKGIYTSPDPNYAVGYGHGAHSTFACLAVVGKIHKASYAGDRGKGLRAGYDTQVSNDRSAKEWVSRRG